MEGRKVTIAVLHWSTLVPLGCIDDEIEAVISKFKKKIKIRKAEKTPAYYATYI
jgi:hypothetical protein